MFFERNPADLSAEPIERGHSIFKSVLHESLAKRLVGRDSECQQLSHDLDVLVQDLDRVVSTAIGTKRKQPVDGVSERTAIAHQFCFEPGFEVPADRGGAAGDLETKTDAE